MLPIERCKDGGFQELVQCTIGFAGNIMPVIMPVGQSARKLAGARCSYF